MAKNIQDFVMRNISGKFEISTCNALCSRGPTKVLAKSKKNACGGHLVFQNEAKNIPRQDFMVMIISCKFIISYNTLASSRVMRKSLYTAAVTAAAAYSCIIHSSTGCYPVDTIRTFGNNYIPK